MHLSVLVTYATRFGSTEEVAHALADSLRENDALTVSILPIQNVDSPVRYDAIVMGTPLYMGHLHKDARHFLTEHRNALTHIPVALFVLGPVRNEEKDWTGARTQVQKELAKFPWLKPVAQQIVGGKYDPANLGFPLNLLPPLRKMKPSDVRDWPAIRTWATTLPAALQPAG